MNKITLTVGAFILVVNVLLGLILSSYSYFNIGLNCAIIAVNVLLLYLVSVMRLKDAFRVSLSLLFSSIATIEFIGGFFAPAQFEDNGFLVFLLLALLFEGILLVVCKMVSK